MRNGEEFAANSAENLDRNRTKPRTSRSIRFSNSEWESIDDETNARGISAADFVRYAALGLAGGRFNEDSKPLPAELVTYIETIYRGVYILATLKRDEMLQEGRQEELDEVVKMARELQKSIQNHAANQS